VRRWSGRLAARSRRLRAGSLFSLDHGLARSPVSHCWSAGLHARQRGRRLTLKRDARARMRRSSPAAAGLVCGLFPDFCPARSPACMVRRPAGIRILELRSALARSATRVYSPHRWQQRHGGERGPGRGRHHSWLCSDA